MLQLIVQSNVAYLAYMAPRAALVNKIILGNKNEIERKIQILARQKTENVLSLLVGDP